MKKIEFNKVQNALTTWINSGVLELHEYKFGDDKTHTYCSDLNFLYNNFMDSEFNHRIGFGSFEDCLKELIPNFKERKHEIFEDSEEYGRDDTTLIKGLRFKNSVLKINQY